MSSYTEALLEFYTGEVLGEAVYSALVGSARNDDERFHGSALICSAMAAPLARSSGCSNVQMEILRGSIANEFIPRYQGHADAALARSASSEEALCRAMVEHERAQCEFAERELAGAGARALEPITKLLRFPLDR